MASPEWIYESTVTDPNGVRVRTTITVPTGTFDDPDDCGELAQMGATHTARLIAKNLTRTPEVPF